MTPTGEIHYQTSVGDSEDRPQLEIARRIPRSEFTPLEDRQSSLSPEQQQLLIALPWKFIEQVAESDEVGWKNCQDLFHTLASREKHVAHRRKLQRMLLSDRQEEIKAAEIELMKLPPNERSEYAFWLIGSKDQIMIDLAKKLATSLHLSPGQFTKIAEKKDGRKPLIRPPQLLLEVAQDYPEAIPSSDFFKRRAEKVNKGIRGGRYEVAKPSHFEIFIQRIVEPLGEMKVDLRTWNTMMRRVDEVIDVVRYGTETLQIDQPDAVEAILESLSTILTKSDIKPESSTRTWDMLAKFVIPESLVPQTLELMIQTGDTDHALAFFLLSRLPEGHPLLIQQREKAELLRSLCDGETNVVMARFEQIQAAREGLISVFPDAIPNEKVGFDYEFLPQIVGLSVPYGMEIGLDGAATMPELRCLPEDEILTYNQEWRQRQFAVWLWSMTAQSREVSIHVHVDGSRNNHRRDAEQIVMSLLFGVDKYDYHYNYSIQTHEVRSALAGYGVDNENGFSDGLNIYGFAELLVALKSAEYQLAKVVNQLPRDFSGEGPSVSRFFKVCQLTKGKDARAAAVVCILGHLGTRVNKTESTQKTIQSDPAIMGKIHSVEERRLQLSLEKIVGRAVRMVEQKQYKSWLLHCADALQWLEEYARDTQVISATLNTLFDQPGNPFRSSDTLYSRNDYALTREADNLLFKLCTVLARRPLSTVARMEYLLKLKKLLPDRHQISVQKYFFETLRYSDDLTDMELYALIEQVCGVSTLDKETFLIASLSNLPKYPFRNSAFRKK